MLSASDPTSPTPAQNQPHLAGVGLSLVFACRLGTAGCNPAQLAISTALSPLSNSPIDALLAGSRLRRPPSPLPPSSPSLLLLAPPLSYPVPPLAPPFSRLLPLSRSPLAISLETYSLKIFSSSVARPPLLVAMDPSSDRPCSNSSRHDARAVPKPNSACPVPVDQLLSIPPREDADEDGKCLPDKVIFGNRSGYNTS